MRAQPKSSSILHNSSYNLGNMHGGHSPMSNNLHIDNQDDANSIGVISNINSQNHIPNHRKSQNNQNEQQLGAFAGIQAPKMGDGKPTREEKRILEMVNRMIKQEAQEQRRKERKKKESQMEEIMQRQEPQIQQVHQLIAQSSHIAEMGGFSRQGLMMGAGLCPTNFNICQQRGQMPGLNGHQGGIVGQFLAGHHELANSLMNESMMRQQRGMFHDGQSYYSGPNYLLDNPYPSDNRFNEHGQWASIAPGQRINMYQSTNLLINNVPYQAPYKSHLMPGTIPQGYLLGRDPNGTSKYFIGKDNIITSETINLNQALMETTPMATITELDLPDVTISNDYLPDNDDTQKKLLGLTVSDNMNVEVNADSISCPENPLSSKLQSNNIEFNQLPDSKGEIVDDIQLIKDKSDQKPIVIEEKKDQIDLKQQTRVNQKNIDISQKSLLIQGDNGNSLVQRVQTLRINLNMSNQAICAQQEMINRDKDRYSTKLGGQTSVSNSVILRTNDFNLLAQNLQNRQRKQPNINGQQNGNVNLDKSIQRNLSIKQRLLKIIGAKRNRSSTTRDNQDINNDSQNKKRRTNKEANENLVNLTKGVLQQNAANQKEDKVKTNTDMDSLHALVNLTNKYAAV